MIDDSLRRQEEAMVNWMESEGGTPGTGNDVWKWPQETREAYCRQWKEAILTQMLRQFCETFKQYNAYLSDLDDMDSVSETRSCKQTRGIVCTPEMAGSHLPLLDAISPGIIVVIGAKAIPESHILAIIGSKVGQLILIGNKAQFLDFKSSIPFAETSASNYHPWSRSLFERLIRSGKSCFNRLCSAMSDLQLEAERKREIRREGRTGEEEERSLPHKSPDSGSAAKNEWERQKQFLNAQNEAIDALMALTG